MIKEILITILIPLVLIVLPSFLLNRTTFYKKLSLLEKYVFSLSISTVFLTSFFIFSGYLLKSGFRTISTVIFCIGILSLIIFMVKNFNTMKVRLKFIFSNKKKIFDPVSLIILLFLAKVLLFSIFKPLIDGDVINSYLPFARSIYLADNIPERNYYNNSLMFFPPLGISVIYAWFYNLTNNIYTESFRLLPIIYIFGSLICFHKIAKIIIGKQLAKFSVLIFICFPFWNEYIFDSLFYPDIIALFLFLSFYHFFLKEDFFQNFNNQKISYYLIISLFLGTTLLFKVQYFIAYYFLGLLFLIAVLPKKWWSNLLLIAGSLPILYRLQRGVGYQLPNSYIVFTFSLIIYALLLLIFHLNRKQQRFNLSSFFILCFGLAMGGLIHVRNIFLYGNFLTPVNKNLTWLYDLSVKVGATGTSQSGFLEWILFIFPAFGSFWLFPKLVGLIESLRDIKLAILTLFIMVWYAINTLMFEQPNNRTMMPIYPFLAIIITLGIEKLALVLKVNSFNFKKGFILISIFFSIFSSSFLWWNGGLLFYGGKNLRKVLNIKTIEQQTNKEMVPISDIETFIKNKIPITYRKAINNKLSYAISKLIDFSFKTTSRDRYYKNNFLSLVYLTLFSSLLLIWLSYLLAKINISFRVLAFFTLSTFFLPYFLTFLLVSRGNILNFKKIEKEELYNYWGQTKYVIPYLKNKAISKDKIFIWSIPTGLSYYTNLKTYNLLYGYYLGEIFKEIFKEKDLEKIYNFYKKNEFSYFVINSNPEVFSQFSRIKKMTRIFDLLENQKYATLEVKPNKENFWYVYKLK